MRSEPPATAEDDIATALAALVWTLSEEARATRLLALTGLAAEELRSRADEPALLGAVIAFLAAHEPDLTGCAAALDLPPGALVTIGERLTGA